MHRPGFHRLWTAFPDHVRYPTLETLYTSLGGAAQRNIHVRGFGPDGNTCASRISVALNAAAAPINPVFVRIAAAATLGTSRGDLIIYRVADLRRYLVAAFGKPEVDSTSPFDDSFRRRKGIIAFSVNWKSATGHIALWDGSVYREPVQLCDIR